jgi:hypothetical protein
VSFKKQNSGPQARYMLIAMPIFNHVRSPC